MAALSIDLGLTAFTQYVITAVQIIGGVTMFVAIYINIRAYLLQRREVTKQNQRIIELLEKILEK